MCTVCMLLGWCHSTASAHFVARDESACNSDLSLTVQIKMIFLHLLGSCFLRRIYACVLLLLYTTTPTAIRAYIRL